MTIGMDDILDSTLPKKLNLRKCNSYRTISLTRNASKVLLIVISNIMKTQADSMLIEQQSAFRTGRSAVEQTANVRILEV